MSKGNSPEHDAIMIELSAQGVSRAEIGRRLGRSVESIKSRLGDLRYIERNGGKYRPRKAVPRAPNGAPLVRLDESEMIEMIRRDGGFRVLPIPARRNPVIIRVFA